MALAPIARSNSYGTLRQWSSINAWVPSSYARSSLFCIKTTVLPSSSFEAEEAEQFACPIILLNYGPREENGGPVPSCAIHAYT